MLLFLIRARSKITHFVDSFLTATKDNQAPLWQKFGVARGNCGTSEDASDGNVSFLTPVEGGVKFWNQESTAMKEMDPGAC